VGSVSGVTLRTDSNGAFRYLHRPKSNTQYRASYGGVDRTAVAFVRLKVRLRLISASARHGAFRVTTPAGPASGVVWFQRRVTRTRWVSLKKYLRAGGVFTVPLPRGTQRVRVMIPKTHGYLSATNSVLVVRG
jgi:hypothetical protein